MRGMTQEEEERARARGYFGGPLYQVARPRLRFGADVVLAAILVALNALDATVTLALIRQGAVEVMRGLAPLWLLAGQWAFAILKVYWSAVLSCVLVAANRRDSRLALPALKVGVTFYSVVLLWQMAVVIGWVPAL